MRGAAKKESRRPNLTSGEDEVRLARNYLARQTSLIVGLLTGLVAVTVLARRLTLAEFGVYGLLLSLTTYLTIVQGVVETAGIRGFAQAVDRQSRDGMFTTVLLVYSAAGAVGGTVVAGAGWTLLGVWNVPAQFGHAAHVAVIALALLTFMSWPLRVFYDALRGNQLFVHAAVAEIAGVVGGNALVVALVLTGAPIWGIIAAAMAGSVLLGVVSMLLVVGSGRLRYRTTRDGVDLASIRSLLALSGWFLVASVADFVIYSLDRTILGAFRSASTVALYEGPLRAHNLVRDVQSAFLGPVLPAAARYSADHDAERTRDLLLRGSRYLLAIVAPVVVVLIVLARPLLVAWLGPRFSRAAPAMAILVGYWLVYASTSVGWNIAVVVGEIRRYALFAASIATANAALSLALTPIFGLYGVALGTAIPYACGAPIVLRLLLPEFGVPFRQFAREVWLPAYTTAAFVAACLLSVRLTVDLATVPACIGAGGAALALFWAIYYVLWLRPEERRLARTLAPWSPVRRGRSA
jgi:O-antigen/teichoic acid export membrane protein